MTNLSVFPSSNAAIIRTNTSLCIFKKNYSLGSHLGALPLEVSIFYLEIWAQAGFPVLPNSSQAEIPVLSFLTNIVFILDKICEKTQDSVLTHMSSGIRRQMT